MFSVFAADVHLYSIFRRRYSHLVSQTGCEAQGGCGVDRKEFLRLNIDVCSLYESALNRPNAAIRGELLRFHGTSSPTVHIGGNEAVKMIES